MSNIGVLWAQYGPYHYARLSALKRLSASVNVHGIEMADLSRDYQWRRSIAPGEVTTLCPGYDAEQLPFTRVFHCARRSFSRLDLQVCLLPSYSPKQSLAALLAARSLGIRTVMMNESHRGTAACRGAGVILKRRLLKFFDAAFVGGRPHQRYFAGLGFSEDRIVRGYDVVDNEYFSQISDQVRKRSAAVRTEYELPARYFLSLGRFVKKKNLATLLRAFRLYVDASPSKSTHLVFVGAGEEGHALKSLCQEYQLPIYHKEIVQLKALTRVGQTETIAPPRVGPAEVNPGVHFYGFRQLDQNPIFYALADAFVLPSIREEWGLVVNEAMASGLPVVVSETAGCAEDLLEPGPPPCAFSADLASRFRELGVDRRICRNGFLFDPRSSQELSRVLLSLEFSEDLRVAMGQASRRIIDSFSCDDFARNALRAARLAQS